MLDALTLDQMRGFVAIAEAGSFRRAALRLARAQSAISHSVANLEAQLGVSLFDRSGHRPVLTAEGQALLADARAILLKVDAMRARARGLGEGVELALSMVIDTLFPLETIGEALRVMRMQYPSVAIRLSIAPLGAPVAALRAGDHTFGIVVGEDFHDEANEFEALSTTTLVAVAAAGSPLAARAATGAPISAAELADHLQIVLEDPSPLSEGRDFGVLSPGIWRVDSQSAKHALIAAGLGWGRLPGWLIARDLAAGRLVRLPALAFGPAGETVAQAYLAHRRDRPLGPAARALRAALLDHAARQKGAPAPARRR